jgi:hypothetical protein
VFSLEKLKPWLLEERTVWGSQSSELALQEALENEVALASLFLCFKALMQAIKTAVGVVTGRESLFYWGPWLRGGVAA